MIAQLALLAFGTFVSEDLTCITAGVLISQGELGFLAGSGSCFLGILAGDLLLFLIGRVAGRRALSWPLLAKLISPGTAAQASDWYERRGPAIVALSRLTPGLRLPTYLAAGVLRTQFWRFFGYFVLAAAVWTPVLVGGTILLGEHASRALVQHGSSTSTIVILGTALAIYGAVRSIRARRTGGAL